MKFGVHNFCSLFFIFKASFTRAGELLHYLVFEFYSINNLGRCSFGELDHNGYFVSQGLHDLPSPIGTRVENEGIFINKSKLNLFTVFSFNFIIEDLALP